MKTDLTHGPVMKTMLRFAVPMILGNLMQQCYNIADTLIVGQFLGAGALGRAGVHSLSRGAGPSTQLGLVSERETLYNTSRTSVTWRGITLEKDQDNLYNGPAVDNEEMLRA